MTCRGSTWIGLVTLTALLLVASGASAGLYNFAEPEEGRLDERYLGRGKFHDTLYNLKNITAEKVVFDYPLRKRYRLIVELAAKAKLTDLSVEQKINLSAGFMRMRMPAEAVKLLGPLATQQRNNFFVHANLGTAYQMLGDQQSRAIASLEHALAVWPKEFNQLSEARQKELGDLGWSEHEFLLFRVMEQYHLKLLKLRSREGIRPWENVDALFDDGKSPPTPVRFVGESGEFEPGKIAQAQKAILDKVRKFPSDPGPLDVVQQLLIWQPDDLRLMWLLGELYNARGDLPAAKYIFEKLGGGLKEGARIATKEFAARRQVMMETPLPDTPQRDLDPELKKAEDNRSVVDWRGLWVGFIAGGAVALFTSWQIREWRRRKQ